METSLDNTVDSDDTPTRHSSKLSLGSSPSVLSADEEEDDDHDQVNKSLLTLTDNALDDEDEDDDCFFDTDYHDHDALTPTDRIIDDDEKAENDLEALFSDPLPSSNDDHGLNDLDLGDINMDQDSASPLSSVPDDFPLSRSVSPEPNDHAHNQSTSASASVLPLPAAAPSSSSSHLPATSSSTEAVSLSSSNRSIASASASASSVSPSPSSPPRTQPQLQLQPQPQQQQQEQQLSTVASAASRATTQSPTPTSNLSRKRKKLPSGVFKLQGDGEANHQSNKRLRVGNPVESNDEQDDHEDNHDNSTNNNNNGNEGNGDEDNDEDEEEDDDVDNDGDDDEEEEVHNGDDDSDKVFDSDTGSTGGMSVSGIDSHKRNGQSSMKSRRLSMAGRGIYSAKNLIEADDDKIVEEDEDEPVEENENDHVNSKRPAANITRRESLSLQENRSWHSALSTSGNVQQDTDDSEEKENTPTSTRTTPTQDNNRITSHMEDTSNVKGTANDANRLEETEKLSTDEEDRDNQQRHREALEALTHIEVEFARLRDKMYQEKMSELNEEAIMIANGTHPELVTLMTEIEEKKGRRISTAEAWRKYQHANFKRQFEGFEYQANVHFISTKTAIRRELLASVNGKRWRLEDEQGKLNDPLQKPGKLIPDIHKLRLQKQVRREETLELQDIKDAIGFPRAPQVPGLSSQDIRDDFLSLGLGASGSH